MPKPNRYLHAVPDPELDAQEQVEALLTTDLVERVSEGTLRYVGKGCLVAATNKQVIALCEDPESRVSDSVILDENTHIATGAEVQQSIIGRSRIAKDAIIRGSIVSFSDISAATIKDSVIHGYIHGATVVGSYVMTDIHNTGEVPELISDAVLLAPLEDEAPDNDWL